MDFISGSSFEKVEIATVSTVALVLTTFVLGATYIARGLSYKTSTVQDGKLPPVIPSSIPFLGQAISFSQSPIEFLLAAYHKHGPVFTFTMVGKTFTYLIGSDAAAQFFNSKNQDLNAEEVYGNLTTPVFGPGVAYDVPNDVFLEQKKMLKGGLNIAHFRQHINVIVSESEDYFKRWKDSGKVNLFEAFSELIILTASSCLHGSEIRSMLDEKVAQLYWDLDGGFTPLAWLLPSWLPLPSFRKRDAAHIKVKEIFYRAIAKRRAAKEPEDDLLQSLLESTYKNGRHLTDEEVAGMLIGMLLAGQHTSSTTSSWLGFFLAKNKNIEAECYNEQIRTFEEDGLIDYDGLKDVTLLERCLKETLRLRPPIMTMMRMCKTPLKVGDYIIPVGHQVCVSPTTNQRLPDTWSENLEWNPNRFLETGGATSNEKFSYIPFGAGRHRCIGESFAYVQIKTIWSTMIRLFEFDLVDGHFPEVNYQTMIHTPLDPIIAYKRRKPLNLS